MMKGATRDKVLTILKWCQERFGKSPYKKTFPLLRVYKTSGFYADNDKFNKCGQYCSVTSIITIFLKSNNSYKELCGTVLHEYKHYLLNTTFSNKQIKSGKQHPHEKNCNRFEKKWKDVCFNELKDKLLS
jgi:hypothetical protein